MGRPDGILVAATVSACPSLTNTFQSIPGGVPESGGMLDHCPRRNRYIGIVVGDWTLFPGRFRDGRSWLDVNPGPMRRNVGDARLGCLRCPGPATGIDGRRHLLLEPLDGIGDELVERWEPSGHE